MQQQRSLASSVSCTGVGVHSGTESTLIFHPAPSGTGIVFLRGDLSSYEKDFIPATVSHVTDTAFCTSIANNAGHTVRTIEHVVAALRGSSIDNVIVEVSSGEVPIMDGSAAPFVEMIEKAGIATTAAKRKSLRILRSVSVTHGDSKAMLIPAEKFGLQMTFNAGRRLNNLSWTFDFSPTDESFREHIASARTFGFYEDAEKMWAAGLAKGTSLENTIVFQNGSVMNETGLRFDDELVRHKLLDAFGDLALAGAHIEGKFIGVNSGHTMHYKLLQELFTDKANYVFE